MLRKSRQLFPKKGCSELSSEDGQVMDEQRKRHKDHNLHAWIVLVLPLRMGLDLVPGSLLAVPVMAA